MIDDFKSTEKKLEALKAEVVRQEEMAAIKKRIELDTVILKHLQKGVAVVPEYQTPILTKREVDWFKGAYCVHQNNGHCACGKYYKAQLSQPLFEGLPKWHIANDLCRTTGRETVFCMCGVCQTTANGTHCNWDRRLNEDLEGDVPAKGTWVVTLPLRPKNSVVCAVPTLVSSQPGSLMTDDSLAKHMQWCEMCGGKDHDVCKCSPCS